MYTDANVPLGNRESIGLVEKQLEVCALRMVGQGPIFIQAGLSDRLLGQSVIIMPLLPVIPDTLSATMGSQTLGKEEGESLELTCEASKATAQHTHLSVTWYLMQDGGRNQTTKIISLSKDFTLIPGPSYTERFAAGDVQLGKLGVSTFRLSIGSLQPSDQGQLFCEATEWIQDPDETWTLITRKQTAQTALRIRPTGNDLLKKFVSMWMVGIYGISFWLFSNFLAGLKKPFRKFEYSLVLVSGKHK